MAPPQHEGGEMTPDSPEYWAGLNAETLAREATQFLGSIKSNVPSSKRQAFDSLEETLITRIKDPDVQEVWNEKSEMVASGKT